MPPVRTLAVVLHSFPYGDTSRILRLLTPELGVRSVIAKGAIGPRSRFGGILEPFTEGEALISLRQGRDLSTLSGFSLIRSRQAIGRDLASFTGASLLAEILIRFGTEEADPTTYRRVVRTLDSLASDAPDPAGTALAALWNLVSLFGFQPELNFCVGCGTDLTSLERSRFDASAGGVTCLRCRPSGRTLSATVRSQIAGMCAGEDASPVLEERKTHGDLLALFLTTYLQGSPLRSLPLYLEQLR